MNTPAKTRPAFVYCQICGYDHDAKGRQVPRIDDPTARIQVAPRGRIPEVHAHCAQVQFALNALSKSLEAWQSAPRSTGASQAVRRLIMSSVMSEANGRFNAGKPNGAASRKSKA